MDFKFDAWVFRVSPDKQTFHICGKGAWPKSRDPRIFKVIWQRYALLRVYSNFIMCDSIYAMACICYRPSVRPSLCPSVTRVDHTKRLKIGS